VLVAGAALLLGLVVGGAARPFTGVAGRAPDGAPPGPCPQGRTIPIMSSPHISQADVDRVRYNSVPPTSGPHFPFAVTTGVYRTPLPPATAVAVLATGHVVIHYAAGTPPAAVADLERIARDHADAVVLTPHPGLAAGIALTAWGCLDRLEAVDEARIAAFVRWSHGRYVNGWTGRLRR
jgi:hypothetical protein